MAKSILHNKEEGTCFLCIILNGDYRKKQTQEHHVFFGKANRKISEKYGLKIYLCMEHHIYGKKSVHKNAEISKNVMEAAQITFERAYGTELFSKLFRRNYITEEREEKPSITEQNGFIKIEDGVEGLEWE